VAALPPEPCQLLSYQTSLCGGVTLVRLSSTENRHLLFHSREFSREFSLYLAKTVIAVSRKESFS